LSFLERSLSELPPALSAAISDLFARPERYGTATDLAIEAGVKERTLWRMIEKNRLGTPKKLVVGAKLLHAYAYLRRPKSNVREVGLRLGFTSRRHLAVNIASMFGCHPSRLRSETHPHKVVLCALDWIYKPPNQRKRRHSEGTDSSFVAPE
jgi:transcriptional regulator GlxA family with amidase domain